MPCNLKHFTKEVTKIMVQFTTVSSDSTIAGDGKNINKFWGGGITMRTPSTHNKESFPKGKRLFYPQFTAKLPQVALT